MSYVKSEDLSEIAVLPEKGPLISVLSAWTLA